MRRAVEENLGRDPLAVALDRRTPHAALVATQVKYLERARTKLPSYYAARCILPPRAFEQASSEACAAHKEPAGDAALDLTCGLGVDALALGRRFRRVVALERDPVLAAVAARNLRLLGAANVEVVCASAEEYLAATTERFDWVAADPDRRSRTGRKLVRLEECSPDILRLLPAVRRVGARLCLKNSPLFDVDEALRLFPTARIEAVSVHGECKELLVYDDGTGPLLRATALGGGSVMLPPATAPTPPPPPFDPTAYAYLFLPDVALQKMRLVRRALEGRADVWSENGFAFPPAGRGRSGADAGHRRDRAVRREGAAARAARRGHRNLQTRLPAHAGGDPRPHGDACRQPATAGLHPHRRKAVDDPSGSRRTRNGEGGIRRASDRSGRNCGSPPAAGSARAGAKCSPPHGAAANCRHRPAMSDIGFRK